MAKNRSKLCIHENRGTSKADTNWFLICLSGFWIRRRIKNFWRQKNSISKRFQTICCVLVVYINKSTSLNHLDIQAMEGEQNIHWRDVKAARPPFYCIGFDPKILYRHDYNNFACASNELSFRGRYFLFSRITGCECVAFENVSACLISSYLFFVLFFRLRYFPWACPFFLYRKGMPSHEFKRNSKWMRRERLILVKVFNYNEASHFEYSLVPLMAWHMYDI